ncbi:probable G-protein coupled receptor B0563.6 isoform X1 [Microplitis demolitor]|uniref:probable G-protein coupled receptor B0563.6 isoform X1 n=2 Tax=Microplitis demolitor TaxID=69319 RepID=UPI0004CCF52E|nr:probable G-protein coupled receptor B0563.6 isoform X1 [Microplitis demolitor]XP_053593850.1 probable G-protein coupled receptor B0563.6 isoform X1 [Microplitis demolitor]XP_053593851.1 probable G-protein coupled receptor B0563.6 isoform X1 [Microplitis demolitor]XP_053593852.1 probable G-protein coupled receptor B0563.6 isoform X1 [Microplitis demolitor]XP_053593853.1 probable G-protein coupled receptor B0563.6 isoform X1 [Microplitis demolitor]XP_053593854.1 probable G-protein coupled rec
MINNYNKSEVNTRLCLLLDDSEMQEDPRTASLRRISYGIILPAICCLGIVGNIFNLVVLTRKNMRGTAYIYMRGYSAAALLAILFCIPFALRVLIHKETGRWSNWPQAFYHAHLELFLGNGCLGVGVMMLLALTIERYVSVCHPGQHTRPLCGPPYFTVSLIPLATFLVYLPSVFKGEVITCLLSSSDSVIYQKRDNSSFMHSIFYQIYKVVLEVVFKVAPTILLAGFNLRIMIVYRKSCERRRKMTSRIMNSGDDDSRSFAEERRLVLLLSSTSILFLICVSPMVILNVTLSESNLTLYSYQMFRALANLLEVTNYSITFYIYCLFSKDFRNTLIRTIKWPWCKTAQNRHRLPMKRSLNPRPTITTSPPTTTVATPGHVSRASV